MTSARQLTVAIYKRSISIREFRDLRDAIDGADRQNQTTVIKNDAGRPLAKIVPIRPEDEAVSP